MITTIHKHHEAVIGQVSISGKKYNVRTLLDKDNEEAYIGGSHLDHDVMENLDKEGYTKMDDKILYYVDEEKLLTLTDDDLIAHIVHNCPELRETFYND